MTQLISAAARDLIVAEEVSSQKTYEARYRHPEWPGGGSGITIGIGYDVGAGVATRAQLSADWFGKISDEMIVALQPCIGVTGERAHALLAQVKNRVDVPWSAAMAVFESVDIPRWYAICNKALPNFELLSPDCKGALLSLAYNRGASFNKEGDRYNEMRAIKHHMSVRAFSLIPGEFRSMKRLWNSQSMRGLVLRREHEAQLFERGMKPVAVTTAPVITNKPGRSPPITSPVKPNAVAKTVTASGVVVGGAIAAKQAHAAGHSPGRIALIVAAVVVVAVAAFVVVRWLKRK